MKFFTSPKDTWDTMYVDCKEAQKSIFFEQFIFEDFDNGEIGQRFAHLFMEKARAGVRVQLLLDIFGSFKILFSKTRKDLREAGVKISFTSIYLKHFLTLSFWKTRRNHRKLTIIDEKIAYVGGVVFTEDVLDWNDFHARIVSDSQIFSHAFFLSKNTPLVDALLDADRDDHFTVLVNNFKKHSISKEILQRLTTAKEKVIIITPYFSPPKYFLQGLVHAVARGVSVIVFFPEESDNHLALLAHHYFIQKLAGTGVEIRTFKKMNHAKIVMIDDWTTFGSCNFDYLSLKYNKELNIAVHHADTIEKINIHLNPMLKDSIPVERSRYATTPLVIRIKRMALGYLVRFFV